MKLRRPVEEQRPEITILPMVNVVFLLLIFFMLVGRVAPEDLGVSPPVSLSGDRETGQFVRLVVAKSGRMLMDGEPVDMTGLIIGITRTLVEDPATKFLLKADANLDANELIRMMETLRRSGVRELTLATERKD